MKNDETLAAQLRLESERNAIALGRKPRRIDQPSEDELKDQNAAARLVDVWYFNCLRAARLAASEGDFRAKDGYSENWGVRKAARACVKKLEADGFTAYWDIQPYQDDCGGDEVVVIIEW